MNDQTAKSLLLDALAQLSTEGDLGELEDAVPALSALLSEHAGADFACAMVALPPTPPVVHPGVEGLARAWRDWGAAFTSLRAELEEILESEHHVVVLVRQRAITRHGGVEISHPGAMVWRFEDGLITRLEMHLDRAAALRSAGLGPQSSQA